MKLIAVAFLLCTLGGASAVGHPIEDVIKLLEGLKTKAIHEGKAEEVDYVKFQYWCTTSSSELKDAIADEKEQIEELEDEISGLEKKRDSLIEEIATLSEEIAKIEATQEAADKQRKKEAGVYKEVHDNLKLTISGVEQCIKALEGAEKTTEGAAFAQRHVKMVLSFISLKATVQERQALEAFANEDPAGEPKKRPDQLAAGDLAAHEDKYDFKSENVIELLKQLKLKFEDDKLQTTKEETNAINAHELATEARTNAHDAATKSKDEKDTEREETVSSIEEKNGVLKSTKEDLEADSESLKKTTDACNVKASEWEERSKTRELEIEAMDMAMKILSKATGVRTEAPGNPVPPPNPVSFLQLSQYPSDRKMKAVILLRQAAKDSNSKALERLAVEVAAHLKGPFAAVNNMIEKMIFRLMDEQKVEDEHKNWCDQEIEKTNTMKNDKEQRIADLKAEIKVQNGKVSKLTDDISAAEAMIADVVQFMKDATEIRQTGKKENALAVKDADQAQTALTNAIAVLEAHYKESGAIPKEPWEFIQDPIKLSEKPGTWDSPYTEVADPTNQPSGIITVLENVLADFSKMEAETKAQEAQDQKEFEDAMQANDIEKAERTQEVEMKTQEKGRRVDKIASLESNKKNTEGELEKTDQYLEDLKPACVDGDSTYEDRKAARATEIEALQKAQVILRDAFKDTEPSLLQKSATKFLQISSHHQVA